ncbi:MAG: ATP-dependent DNA helicase [Planctomycetota bacterium]|nr:MAG: ATP-dependent DNA helicase [Planctomycetota bacterium]
MHPTSETEFPQSAGPEDLTPSQQRVVSHRDGPLLVLAGPGSGKTRVVTRRIAQLVASGVSPHSILAITFTNKAADEMARRVEELLPGSRVWVSTFHRFCARLLRRHAEFVGLKPNYTILDTSDQKTALKAIVRDLDIDAVLFSPARIGYEISNAKNDLIDAESFVRKYDESVADHRTAIVARVYPAYQKWLLDSNAVDFDDLLLHVATLLSENEELRSELSARYRYLLVDEYQDTNRAQYQIVAALGAAHGNVCVTGDPDQSIYGWRGARIENILRFERDFPATTTIRLEENFRSTKAILRSADRLISYNRQRKVKTLVTDNGEGEPVELLIYENEIREAEGIAEQICDAVERGDRDWSDFAVFMRVNALSRQLELALMRRRVPFQVAAGAAFYDRAEIKDVVAYLRLLYNPADRAAFLRVVNTPLRGLGETSRRRLVNWADRQGVTLLDAAARAGEIESLSKRAARGFAAFAETVSSLSLADAGSVEHLLAQALERTGYLRQWQGSSSEKDQERVANVQELLSAARQFDANYGEETSLEGFLEQTALISDTDALDTSRGKVTLMTLHAAKGLEYPVVFILGLEQGLIPHERATRDAGLRELEEERRLLFVGMTRAREELYLTQTEQRSFRGRTLRTIPSDFTPELECSVRRPGRSPSALPTWRPLPATADGTIDAARPLLTTAADLLNGTNAAAKLPIGFSVGSQVRHPRYGVGTVVDVGGFGHRRTVTVAFQADDRRETFVAAKSPLQPIGRPAP